MANTEFLDDGWKETGAFFLYKIPRCFSVGWFGWTSRVYLFIVIERYWWHTIDLRVSGTIYHHSVEIVIFLIEQAALQHDVNGATF
jgi:hypothetical protein